jgi:hypothetical protein
MATAEVKTEQRIFGSRDYAAAYSAASATVMNRPRIILFCGPSAAALGAGLVCEHLGPDNTANDLNDPKPDPL